MMRPLKLPSIFNNLAIIRWLILYSLSTIVDHHVALSYLLSNSSGLMSTEHSVDEGRWSSPIFETLRLRNSDGESDKSGKCKSYSQGISYKLSSSYPAHEKSAIGSQTEWINLEEYPCNIEKIDLRLTEGGVRSEKQISLLPNIPVIYVGWPDRNIFLSLLASRTNLTSSPNG